MDSIIEHFAPFQS